jgi:hypothetical protein
VDREASFFTKILQFEKTADFRLVGSEWGKLQDVFNASMRIVHLGGQFITPEAVAIPQDAQAQLGFKRAILVRDPTGHALRLVEE